MRLKTLFLLASLIALILLPISQSSAQTFTNLYHFTALSGPSGSPNSDGANPQGDLFLSDDALYGTAVFGGASGHGTAFSVNTDGTDFTNLHNFSYSTGAHPEAGLILSGNTLYGTTAFDSIFSINANGTNFTNLHNFVWGGSEGNTPEAGLVLAGSTLYGTTSQGGTSVFPGPGTIFAINTNGSGFTNLYSFTTPPGSVITNTDGATPLATLILSGNTLYGTTRNGGNFGYGTVFAVNTNGAGFTTLHHFTGDNDGAWIQARLVLSGDTLYGTARAGGIPSIQNGYGTLFSLKTNGADFTVLHSFTNLVYPNGLNLSGDTLYGTTVEGGSSNKGTVFAIKTNGTSFTNLHDFNGINGANPYAALLFSNNILYGTTEKGGSGGSGTVFKIALPQLPESPSLKINLSETNVVLTWPTNALNLVLQSSTNLISPIIWNAVSPSPTVINGQNVVTNSIFSVQNFYRLGQ